MESTIERELPDNQAGFKKAQGKQDHIANMRWIMERQLEYGQEVYICFIDYTASHLTASIMNYSGKLYYRWKYRNI